MKSKRAAAIPSTDAGAMGRRTVLRNLSSVVLAASLPAVSLAQSVNASYSIRYSPLARSGALGFVAQNLAIARTDPADPDRNLQIYVGRALARFRERHGRDPANDVERAMAVVDWVATVMRHPAFYPEDPGLPRLYPQVSSPVYETLAGEAVRILNYTLSFDPGDLANWPSPLCTFQNYAAAGMLNLLGLHARLVDVEGHTGLEFYSFTHYKWIWMDATYNEHYVATDGKLLGVLDLHRLTLRGGIDQVRPVKHGYPTAAFRSNTYLWLQPRGFRQYAVTLYMDNFGSNGRRLSKFHTVVYSPVPSPDYQPLPGEILNYDRYPESGGWNQWPQTDNPESLDTPIGRLAMFDGVTPGSNGINLRLLSYLPYTQRFEMRLGNEAWLAVHAYERPENGPVLSSDIVAPWSGGTVSVRAVDNVGNATLALVIAMTP